VGAYAASLIAADGRLDGGDHSFFLIVWSFRGANIPLSSESDSGRSRRRFTPM
jgi:hypothetical protein